MLPPVSVSRFLYPASLNASSLIMTVPLASQACAWSATLGCMFVGLVVCPMRLSKVLRCMFGGHGVRMVAGASGERATKHILASTMNVRHLHMCKKAVHCHQPEASRWCTRREGVQRLSFSGAGEERKTIIARAAASQSTQMAV